MKQPEPILGGIAQRLHIPGAPELGPDVHLRHLFRTVEGQRNLALSALAELQAQYGVLGEQYAAHVQQLTAELTRVNHDKSRMAAEIVELKAGREPKPSDNVTKSASKSKTMDKD